ncbi:MAG: hypothetical protein EOM53_02280 [Alphaproteobacteria bacterium]|nr:hypothetical protein [Alphaproteobacteria bacterium]NCB49491.1 hypothetical protein [Alphaproteobacteria bacterium]
MKEFIYCPEDCPFLKEEKNLKSKKLPYFCGLFGFYLATHEENILRCEECIGFQKDVSKSDMEDSRNSDPEKEDIEKSLRQKGLGYISSSNDFSIHKQNTKWGFSRLPLNWQKRFVSVAQKMGEMDGVPKGVPLRSVEAPKILLSSLSKKRITRTALPKDAQEFSDLLTSKAEQFPNLLDKKAQILLTNLFQVLDSSEKSILQNIIKQPALLKSFMKTFNSMPKKETLLKDLRRELEEIEKKREDELFQEQQQQKETSLLNQKLRQNQNIRIS